MRWYNFTYLFSFIVFVTLVTMYYKVGLFLKGPISISNKNYKVTSNLIYNLSIVNFRWHIQLV